MQGNRENHLELLKQILRALIVIRKIQKFLSQPFHEAEVFTGKKGRFVKLEDTIKGFKGILEGKYDDIPEQAFYMVGTIEEVLEKAEEMKGAA